jgi:hypothetical protein
MDDKLIASREGLCSTKVVGLLQEVWLQRDANRYRRANTASVICSARRQIEAWAFCYSMQQKITS